MRSVLGYLGAFINFVFGLFGALLGLRLILRLFGANSGNEFVQWIYDTSRPLIEPFETIFPTVRVEDGFVIEISTIFAMVVYGVIAALLLSLIEGLAAREAPAKTTKKRK